jgi:rod shape determining protein RodA
VGPISVQPSELFKVCFVLMAVWLLTSRWAQPIGKLVLALVAPLIFVPAVLIIKQPDLGTALLLFPVLIALLVAAGMRMRLLGGLVLAGLAATPLAWVFLKEYQRERILVFLDPFRDPLGSAYNVIQAKIAIGSGQLLGKGVAGATQSRLAFLPERHTDFIFAVFAETWGFVGCLVLLICYALLLLRGFDIAASTRELVGRLVALGVTALLATQILVNVAMVTGLIPVVGIPLPFMSYGGSSMVVSMMALGLLLSVRMRQFQ